MSSTVLQRRSSTTRRLSSKFVPACFSYSLREVSKSDRRLDSEEGLEDIVLRCKFCRGFVAAGLRRPGPGTRDSLFEPLNTSAIDGEMDLTSIPDHHHHHHHPLVIDKPLSTRSSYAGQLTHVKDTNEEYKPPAIQYWRISPFYHVSLFPYLIPHCIVVLYHTCFHEIYLIPVLLPSEPSISVGQHHHHAAFPTSRSSRYIKSHNGRNSKYSEHQHID